MRSKASSSARVTERATAPGWRAILRATSAPLRRCAPPAVSSQPSISARLRRARTAAIAMARRRRSGVAWWTLPVATTGRPWSAAIRASSSSSSSAPGAGCGGELDHDVVEAEPRRQGVQRLRGRPRSAGGERTAYGALAAAGQHDPVAAAALGELVEVVDGPPLLVTAQVRLRHRPGQTVVALDATGEDQQVAALGVGYAVLRAGETQGQLGAVDRRQRVHRRRLGQHRRPVEPVVVGQGQAGETQPDRLGDQLAR